jgi:hypothetical protein
VQQFGRGAAFGGYLGLMVPCAAVSWLLETDPLRARHGHGGGGGDVEGKPAAAATVAAAAAARPVDVELAAEPPAGSGDRDLPRPAPPRPSSDQGRPRKGAVAQTGEGLAPKAPPQEDKRQRPHPAAEEDADNAPLLQAAAALPDDAAGTAAARGGAAAAAGGGSFWERLSVLLSCPAVLVFFGQATIMGFGIGAISEFLFLYLSVGGTLRQGFFWAGPWRLGTGVGPHQPPTLVAGVGQPHQPAAERAPLILRRRRRSARAPHAPHAPTKSHPPNPHRSWAAARRCWGCP